MPNTTYDVNKGSFKRVSLGRRWQCWNSYENIDVGFYCNIRIKLTRQEVVGVGGVFQDQTASPQRISTNLNVPLVNVKQMHNKQTKNVQNANTTGHNF